MARGEVVNSIHDLQFEWASNHANKSVRDFLINVKGFTPRRYRYVMQQAPALQWNTRRQELQNNVLSAKQDALLQDALETNNQIFKTAKLGAALTMRDLSVKGEKGRLSSKELVDYMRSLETTQTVAMKALGIAPEIERRTAQTSEPCSPIHSCEPPRDLKSDPLVDQFTYDDVITLIEIKREWKQRTAMNEGA
ncbi:MAG: hypothetical protein SGJ18_05470 [Pseudomonadota bacterium]|nr:hypothetical protein [Pseudomonadota bacterium]